MQRWHQAAASFAQAGSPSALMAERDGPKSRCAYERIRLRHIALSVRGRGMSTLIVLLDFEASSLGKHGFPIEVGWAAEDGTEAGHLIRPAPGWEEWSSDAERIHGITLDRLRHEGEPHEVVATHMVQVLSGHDLYASAPSWDGHWLSRLLRAAGLPRHALRLRDTEEVQTRTVIEILDAAGIPSDRQCTLADDILVPTRRAFAKAAPAHRALDDARRELQLWQEVRRRAEEATSRAHSR